MVYREPAMHDIANKILNTPLAKGKQQRGERYRQKQVFVDMAKDVLNDEQKTKDMTQFDKDIIVLDTSIAENAYKKVLNPPEKKKGTQKAPVELADMNPQTYVNQIKELNAVNNGKDHAKELTEIAASLLTIESISKKADKLGVEAIVSQKEFDKAVRRNMRKPDFQRMMNEKFGDLNDPESAKKFGKAMEKKVGKGLYADYMMSGAKRKTEKKKQDEVRLSFHKRQEKKNELAKDLKAPGRNSIV